MLLGDVLRPLPKRYALSNTAVQMARHRLVRQYRRVIDVGAELHRELNG